MSCRHTRTFCLVAASAIAGGCFKPSDSNDSGGGTDSDSGTTTGASATQGETTASTSQSTSATSATSATTTSATSDESGATTNVDGTGSDGTGADASGSTSGGGECGNGVVEPGEGCDDGTNAGMMPGDCAPDCSKAIEIKEIIKSVDTFSGDFASLGPGSVIENLDDQCPFGYAAMFSDGFDRVATVTPNTGDGQVDWSLSPWTAYVNLDGDLLAITDGAALLGVHGGVFMPLTNAILPGDNSGTWSGLNQDWTALGANENCNNWTNATNNYQMMTGVAGQTSVGFLRQSQDFTYPCGDGVPKRIYCAEQ